MSKRLFTGVFFLVLLAFMAGQSYACPILKAIIGRFDVRPAKPTWVYTGGGTGFTGSESVGPIVNCTWSLPGAYDIHYSTVRYLNDTVSCKYGGVATYTVTLTVRDSQGRTDTDTCAVYVVSIGIAIAPGESSYIAVNNDDDNENGIMDMCEDGTVSNEDTQPYDLRKILLFVNTPKLDDKVKLVVIPEYKMKIWSNRDKGNRVVPPPDKPNDYWVELPAWSSPEPHEFYVEALSSWWPDAPCVGFGYIGVNRNTTPPTEELVYGDPPAPINFTLLEVDVDIEGVKDDYYGEGPVTEETKPGGFIPLNGLVKINLMSLAPSDLPISAAHPVTLKAISGGDKIRIWDNENKTGTPITLPKKYESRWSNPIPLWVEGTELSSTPRDITLALEYAGFEDRIRATVVKVNLNMAGVPDDYREENPGGYISVNDDDDNNNGIPDKDEAPVNGENDLVAISLSILPANLNSGEVELRVLGNTPIKVWRYPDKRELIIPSNDPSHPSNCERWPPSQLPPTLYVEGMSTTFFLGGWLDLSYVIDQQVYIHTDLVKITIFKLQITEPDENPVTDNNFTFNDATPGVCNVTGWGTTGVLEMDPELQWSISGITGSTLTSEPPDRKGPDITFTYTTLPSSWVAWKNLYLTHPAVSCWDYQLVEIFFLRDEYNNPGGINPNWYYYWSKTSASSGTHDYNETIPWDGCYTDGDNFFEIGPSAKDQDGGLVVKGDGIDNFGSTCLHEKAHMDYYFSAWDPYNPNLDRDENVGDGLKDGDEPGLTGLNGQPYNPNKIDTNGDMYADDEDYACKFENTWEVESHDYEDWANPGHRSDK